MMVIAGVVATILVINAVYPAVIRSSNSIVNASQSMKTRIETQISIVFATSELDSSGSWQDIDGDGKFDITAWIKNVGNAEVQGIDEMDVFIGTTGSFERVPYVDDAGGSYPSWSYTLENGTRWTNTVTAKISIHYSSAQASDTYLIKIIVPSGGYDEGYFSF